MITGGILEVATFGAYTIGFGFQEAAGLALIGHGLSLTTIHAQDMSFSGSRRGFVDYAGGSYSMPQIASNGYGGFVTNKAGSVRHTPDQEALSDLVKGVGKKRISNTDADTLLDWANEYDFPARDDRGMPPHWVGGEHIHLGPKHVPVRN